MTASCLHPTDEKLYEVDQPLNPTVSNQFPLCIPFHEKGWSNKSFTAIAKRVKIGYEVQVVDENIVEEVENDDDDYNTDD